MTASSPAIAGAIGGFALGAVEFVLVMAMVRHALTRETEEGGDMPGLSAVAARFARVRRGLAAFSFLFLPVLGFAIGAALGGPESSK